MSGHADPPRSVLAAGWLQVAWAAVAVALAFGPWSGPASVANWFGTYLIFTSGVSIQIALGLRDMKKWAPVGALLLAVVTLACIAASGRLNLAATVIVTPLLACQGFTAWVCRPCCERMDWRLSAKTLTYDALIIGALIFIIPFYSMFITSIKTRAELQNATSLADMLRPSWPDFSKAESLSDCIGLIYHRWRMGYRDVFRLIPFGRYFANTCFVVAMSCFGTLVSCPLVAYSFSRIRYPGRDILFFVLISTMMLPFQVTMVPLFLIFKQLGWVNTLLPLWLPTFLGHPFYIFLLRQFMMTIPRELEDAARVDGCGHFGIYWRIILPLVRPALVSVLIFQFVFSWNDFVGPLIYVHDREMMTLSIGLQGLRHIRSSEWPMLLAGATMMTVPVIIVFFALQRYFIRGVTLTGLKG